MVSTKFIGHLECLLIFYRLKSIKYKKWQLQYFGSETININNQKEFRDYNNQQLLDRDNVTLMKKMEYFKPFA